MQFTAQITFALHINCEVDGFVGHPHLRIVGEIDQQPRGDLGRAVLFIFQPGGDLVAQTRIGGKLARPTPAGPLPGQCMRAAGPIPWVGSQPPRNLAPNRYRARYRPLQTLFRLISRITVEAARPSRCAIERIDSPRATPVLNLFTFFHAQTTTRTRNGFIRKYRLHPASISKPPTPGGLRHAHSQPSPHPASFPARPNPRTDGPPADTTTAS